MNENGRNSRMAFGSEPSGVVDESRCESCCENLESWVDGQQGAREMTAVDLEEAQRVQQHLDQCESCREEARWALEVHRSLADLPDLVCPDEVLEGVERARRRLESRGSARWWIGRFTPEQLPTGWSPTTALLAAAALLGAIALAGTWMVRVERPLHLPPTDSIEQRDLLADDLERQLAAEGYSLADLERAEREAKVALAMLGVVSQRAGLVLRDDVLKEQVAMPPRRALERWTGAAELAAGDDG